MVSRGPGAPLLVDLDARPDVGAEDQARRQREPYLSPAQTSWEGKRMSASSDERPVVHSGRCEREDCVARHRKLKDAMVANRAWERRFNELYRESKSYTQDLERQLKERHLSLNRDSPYHPEKPSGSSAALVSDLERQVSEERERTREARRSIEVLDGELRTARAELHDERRFGRRQELEIMRQQLQIFKADFEKERAERRRVEVENESLREQIARAHQVATTNQDNFMTARKEKEELQIRLRELTGDYGGDYFARRPPKTNRPYYDYGGYGDEDG